MDCNPDSVDPKPETVRINPERHRPTLAIISSATASLESRNGGSLGMDCIGFHPMVGVILFD